MGGFRPAEFGNSISGDAEIHPTALVAGKNVRIGNGCRIGPHVVVNEYSLLGEGVTVGPGSVLGADPFIFAEDQGRQVRVEPAGGVLIEKKVTIHANACIERSLVPGYTRIGEYSKVDNLVHIGNHASIGKRSYVVASSLVGMNARIGDDAWVGPRVIVGDHLEIGDRSELTMGSVVEKDIGAGMIVKGNFVMELGRFRAFTLGSRKG